MDSFVILGGQPKVKVNILADGKVTEDGDGAGTPKEIERFSMGALAGYVMAKQGLEDQGVRLQDRDKVTITRIGAQPNADPKLDDMILFKVEVER
jgi:hypothetical protein